MTTTSAFTYTFQISARVAWDTPACVGAPEARALWAAPGADRIRAQLAQIELAERIAEAFDAHAEALVARVAAAIERAEPPRGDDPFWRAVVANGEGFAALASWCDALRVTDLQVEPPLSIGEAAA